MGSIMTITRRTFALTLGAFGLSACRGTIAQTTSRSKSTGLAPDMRPQPNAGYDAWVASFKTVPVDMGSAVQQSPQGFVAQGICPVS